MDRRKQRAFVMKGEVPTTKEYTHVKKLIFMSWTLEISMRSSVQEKQTHTTCLKESVRKVTQFGPAI